MEKIGGRDNSADLMTKSLDRQRIEHLLATMNAEFRDAAVDAQTLEQEQQPPPGHFSASWEFRDAAVDARTLEQVPCAACGRGRLSLPRWADADLEEPCCLECWA